MYQIAIVGTNHALTLATTAGTQTGVAYTVGTQWSDTSDHVAFAGWNEASPGAQENAALEFPFGDHWEYNWCTGGGDATVERHIGITLPDGAGSTFLYRPFFFDVSKTANGAARTHVGYTNMFLAADAFTLGSITSLSGHTITNYFSAGPTTFNVVPNAIFSGSITENSGGNANAGLVLYSESGQMGGASNNIYFHAGGTSLGTCAAAGTFYFPGTSTDAFYCPASSGSPVRIGTQAIHTIGVGGSGGYYANSSGGVGLAGDVIQHPATFGGGTMFATSYTDDADYAGFAFSANGSTSSATIYGLVFNTGTPPTALSSFVFGGQSGVSLAMRGGGTQGLLINSSGNVGYGSGGTLGVSVSGILCTASFTTVQGGVTACTATSDPL